MKKIVASILILLATVPAFAQDKLTVNADEPFVIEPISEILLPILFMSFLVFMLVSLVKYFLEYRLKNKLIERGTPEQLSAYLSNKNDKEKQNEAIKLAILFCGLGTGLILVYLTAPIQIHSLAIMALSLGLSYLAYFFYLRK
jgi:hypothetical protein